MGFSTDSVLLFLLCSLSIFSAAAQATGSCKADNCLNALNKTTNPSQLAAAQSFCATFTTAVTTATTAIPTYASVGCATNISRVSSACSCLPTPTITPTPSTTKATTVPTACSSIIVDNGNWESGSLAPWTVNPYSYDNTPSDLSYCISYPGYGGSKYQFIADLKGKTLSEVQINQNLNLCLGIIYKVTLNYRFDFTVPKNHTNLDVYINGGHTIYLPADGTHGGLGVWAQAEGEFITRFSAQSNVYIVFQTSFGDSARMSIDDVFIRPVGVDPYS